MAGLPKLIPVTGNNFALVDEQDYEELSKYNWQLSHGYAQRHLTNAECEARGIGYKTCVRMHNEILGEKVGEQDTDHINSNGLDNRRSNLRRCTTGQNCAWARKQLYYGRPDRLTTSQYKGVSFRSDRKRWTAYVGTGQKRQHLGCYATEEAAAAAYNRAARKTYGEFARLNEIPLEGAA